MNKIVVFGNGQMAEIAHVYIASDSPYDVAAFCVNEDCIKEKTFRGLSVVPFENIEVTYPPSEYNMFIPIGAKNMNTLRAEKYYEAKRKGYRFISYISSKATICPEVEIGTNCFILENNVIQSFVKIGDNVVLWSGNHIGHHGTIMNHCFLSSHVVVCGKVTIEPYCYFGVNSTIRDEITVKEKCLIGAGALVMRDTKEKEVYKGSYTMPYKKTTDAINVN